jgi:hypothetical protein
MSLDRSSITSVLDLRSGALFCKQTLLAIGDDRGERLGEGKSICMILSELGLYLAPLRPPAMTFLRYSVLRSPALVLIPLLCGSTLSIAAAPAIAATAGTAPQETKLSSPKTRTGLPGRRTGGGARAGVEACTQKTPTEELTAIVPLDAAVKTISADPKLMFFVPTGTADRQAEVILKGADGNTLDRQLVPVGAAPAFLQIPVSDKALETDQAYRWEFKLRCADNAVALAPLDSLTKGLATKGLTTKDLPKAGSKPRGEDNGIMSVNGSLTRIDPLSLTSLSKAEQAMLKGPQSLEQAAALIKAGLWSDAAANVCHIVTDKATPSDLKSKGQAVWKGMLSSLNLPVLRVQPMAKILLEVKRSAAASASEAMPKPGKGNPVEAPKPVRSRVTPVTRPLVRGVEPKLKP